MWLWPVASIFFSRQDGVKQGSLCGKWHEAHFNTETLYIRNPIVESCRLIYVRVESEGGGFWGESEFFGPPTKNLLGHSYKIMEISAGSLAQAQSVGTLLKQIG